MTTNVTSPLPGQRGQSRFAAWTASAALRREHVGALRIGTVESFGLRHSRGRTVSLMPEIVAITSGDQQSPGLIADRTT
jgi:hypothetical protein